MRASSASRSDRASSTSKATRDLGTPDTYYSKRDAWADGGRLIALGTSRRGGPLLSSAHRPSSTSRSTGFDSIAGNTPATARVLDTPAITGSSAARRRCKRATAFWTRRPSRQHGDQHPSAPAPRDRAYSRSDPLPHIIHGSAPEPHHLNGMQGIRPRTSEPSDRWWWASKRASHPFIRQEGAVRVVTR